MVEITEDGRIDLADFGRALERRPKIVAFPYVSNALGTVNPAARLTALAHAAGAVVVVDGAQSTPHLKVDVQGLDCDFYALSGHKMLGPMGSGALVAKPELLEAMPPYHGGGEIGRASCRERGWGWGGAGPRKRTQARCMSACCMWAADERD